MNQEQIQHLAYKRMLQLKGGETLQVTYGELSSDELGNRLCWWLENNGKLSFELSNDLVVTVAMEDMDAVAYMFGSTVVMWLDDKTYLVGLFDPLTGDILAGAGL